MSTTSETRSAATRFGAIDLALGALLFLAALGLRWVAVRATEFDGLYGQDPFAYLDYSIALRRTLDSPFSARAAGLFSARAAGLPFHWPIGYPLQVAAATALVGDAVRAAQLVSVLAAALTAVLVFALVRELQPAERAGALVAGLLTASASQLMISSLSVMSDATALAWLTLSAWALVRHQRALSGSGPSPALPRERLGEGPFAWLALAAFAFALATLTRWACLFAAPPFALSTLLAWRTARVPRSNQIAASAATLATLALVVGLPLFPELTTGQLQHVGDFRQVGWDPFNAFRSTITNSDGVMRYERPVGLYYALPPIHPSFVFPLLSPFLLLGVIELFGSPRALRALLLGWPVAVYLVLAGIAWENPRLSLTLLPPLLVLVGIGFGRALRSPYRRGAIACAVLGLLGSLAWSVRDVRNFTAVKQAQLDTVRWAERSTPEGAIIASFGLTQTLQHYANRRIADLWSLGPEALAELSSDAAPLYLVVDPVNLDDQWRGRKPATNFHWFENHTRLEEIARRPPWILFKVGGKAGPSPQPSPAGCGRGSKSFRSGPSPALCGRG